MLEIVPVQAAHFQTVITSIIDPVNYLLMRGASALSSEKTTLLLITAIIVLEHF